MQPEGGAVRIWIRGTGDYCAAVDPEPPPLKEVVHEALGTSVRRVGRFIQLALVGTGRCVGSHAPPEETAVYLASARGDLATTLNVVETLFRDGRPPMPLNFINTVSNAPSFYIARHYGLAGRSQFVCSRCFALESVLELACLDMAAGYMESALVGSVDIASAPVRDHRVRLGLAPEAPVGEGSHWLWLWAGEAPPDAQGELVAARTFVDRGELLAWLGGLGLASPGCVVAGGQFADDADVAAVLSRLDRAGAFARPNAPGHYDSQAGMAINAFLREGGGDYLVHVNGEIDGPRLAAVVVRRVGTPASHAASAR